MKTCGISPTLKKMGRIYLTVLYLLQTCVILLAVPQHYLSNVTGTWRQAVADCDSAIAVPKVNKATGRIRLPEPVANLNSAWVGLYETKQYMMYYGCFASASDVFDAVPPIPMHSLELGVCLYACETKYIGIKQGTVDNCYCLKKKPKVSNGQKIKICPVYLCQNSVASCGSSNTIAVYSKLNPQPSNIEPFDNRPTSDCVSFEVTAAKDVIFWVRRPCSGSLNPLCERREGLNGNNEKIVGLAGRIVSPWLTAAGKCDETEELSYVTPHTIKKYNLSSPSPSWTRIFREPLINVVKEEPLDDIMREHSTVPHDLKCGYITKDRTGSLVLEFGDCYVQRKAMCTDMNINSSTTTETPKVPKFSTETYQLESTKTGNDEQDFIIIPIACSVTGVIIIIVAATVFLVYKKRWFLKPAASPRNVSEFLSPSISPSDTYDFIAMDGRDTNGSDSNHNRSVSVFPISDVCEDEYDDTADARVLSSASGSMAPRDSNSTVDDGTYMSPYDEVEREQSDTRKDSVNCDSRAMKKDSEFSNDSTYAKINKQKHFPAYAAVSKHKTKRPLGYDHLNYRPDANTSQNSDPNHVYDKANFHHPFGKQQRPSKQYDHIGNVTHLEERNDAYNTAETAVNGDTQPNTRYDHIGNLSRKGKSESNDTYDTSGLVADNAVDEDFKPSAIYDNESFQKDA